MGLLCKYSLTIEGDCEGPDKSKCRDKSGQIITHTLFAVGTQLKSARSRWAWGVPLLLLLRVVVDIAWIGREVLSSSVVCVYCDLFVPEAYWRNTQYILHLSPLCFC